MTALVTYSAKTVGTDRIRRFTLQPREYFDPVEITARAESMKAVGQQSPVTVEAVSGDPKHDYELIDGESRWLSAKKAGIAKMLVLVRSAPFASVSEKHLASLVANFNRSEHTLMEVSNALLKQINSGMTQRDLATALGKTEFWVSDHLLLQKLHPEIQALLNPRAKDRDRISMASAIALTTVPVDKQLGVLKAVRKSAHGRITLQGVKDAAALVDGRTTRKKSASRQRRIAEGALKTIGAAAEKLDKIPRREAQQIFDRLKDEGQLAEFDSLGELLHALGRPAAAEFPGLPVLRDGATDDERAAHAGKLREYWLSKCDGATDVPFLAIAYPNRHDWAPMVPTTWHKGLP